ncbi:MAG: alpha/beta fold hydrolase [Candidatus Eremiobacteraeota bacterium]|nr:alpha/beta fold hydrolase [Candidatus Eremiobacteraeota bacterium]
MLDVPASRPAASYGEALERIAAFCALDDGSILPRARSYVLQHGARSPLAVVLLHGITNHPGQYVSLAPLLHERGHNVFVPRLPEHGDVNRMTTRLKSLTAERLLASANEALDIACGLGERVCILGISTSGLLCAYFAQYRADVARAVPVNPVFGMLHIPYEVNEMIEKILLTLPNFFVWWDPRNKENQLPSTGYPRFSTRALMQCLRIGNDVHHRAKESPIRAKSIFVITNRLDPAVNNDVTSQVVKQWRIKRGSGIETFEFTNLPKNHDIIDPENAAPRLDLVYPKLLEVVDGTPGA